MIFYSSKVHSFKCNGSRVISIKKYELYLPAALHVHFFCSSLFENQLAFNILESHVDWFRFCNYLRSLHVRHFGVVEDKELKVWHRGHLKCHDLPVEFHKYVPTGSNVISVKHIHTDRRTA
jgi:hypothetical protein